MPDLAIDLGSANTVIYAARRGIVLNEPSVVALDTQDGGIFAVGTQAKRLIGRTPPRIRIIRPIRDGVIAHLGTTEVMLRSFIRKALAQWPHRRPRVVVCSPAGMNEIERRAILDAVAAARARAVFLIQEPIAAAIGAGLDLAEPTGHLVVDIGGGTTEVAVLAFGGIVAATSLRIGGDEMDEAIVQHVRKSHSVGLGDISAESIKIRLGSAHPPGDDRALQARGRDLVTGLPSAIRLTGTEVYRAIEEPLAAIVDAVLATLDGCPPELAADVTERGMVLAGGGALLGGLDRRLAQETSLPVHVADDPLLCVARGAGECIENLRLMSPLLIRAHEPLQDAA